MKQNLLKYLIHFIFLAFFLLCFLWGFKKAEKIQISKVVLKNTEVLQSGLQFFYNDYERYPKVTEFSNLALMKSYFNTFPVKEFRNQKCLSSFKYERIDSKKYVLNFCLLEDTENYLSGWNKVTELDIRQ